MDLENKIKEILRANNLILEDLYKRKNISEEDKSPKVNVLCHDNVVNKEKLREVQKKTLSVLREYISTTFGPMASNTEIITGNNLETIDTQYSKDGLNVLKKIIFSQPLEMSIQSEIYDVAHYVEHKVGDGTTSAVILSSFVFELLALYESMNDIPPRRLEGDLKACVDKLKSMILENRKEITIEDVYNIAMVSTNGNKRVSTDLQDLYKSYGFNLDVTVGLSNNTDTKIKIYDGISINEGYSDPVYINNKVSNSADIHEAKVYHFVDPIDTPEMVTFLETIIETNIVEPMNSAEDYTPTVILCPKISRDVSPLLAKIVEIDRKSVV